MARIAIADGDLAHAEQEFSLALEELRRYPVPLLEWRTHADLGRLKSKSGDPEAARKSFAQAAEIIKACAASVTDEDLRATFLDSPAVQSVMAGAA